VIRVSIRSMGGQETIGCLEATNAQVRAALRLTAEVNAADLRGRVLAGLFSGDGMTRPKSRMGTLARGVRSEVNDLPNGVRVRLGMLESVPYARILEFGGIQPERFIRPRFKKALMWFAGGGRRAVFMAQLWLRNTYGGARRGGQALYGRALLGLAFSKGHRIKQRYQRAMPYLAPAILEAQPAMTARVRAALAAVAAAQQGKP